MSETNLVPWPLRIVQIGSEGIAIKPDSGDLRIDAKTLAMCSSCALALLFAAAPDMVAALKKCDTAFVAWQVGQIPGRPEDILALITEVRAAIAKAGTQ